MRHELCPWKKWAAYSPTPMYGGNGCADHRSQRQKVKTAPVGSHAPREGEQGKVRRQNRPAAQHRAEIACAVLDNQPRGNGQERQAQQDEKRCLRRGLREASRRLRSALRPTTASTAASIRPAQSQDDHSGSSGTAARQGASSSIKAEQQGNDQTHSLILPCPATVGGDGGSVAASLRR